MTVIAGGDMRTTTVSFLVGPDIVAFRVERLAQVMVRRRNGPCSAEYSCQYQCRVGRNQ